VQHLADAGPGGVEQAELAVFDGVDRVAVALRRGVGEAGVAPLAEAIPALSPRIGNEPADELVALERGAVLLLALRSHGDHAPVRPAARGAHERPHVHHPRGVTPIAERDHVDPHALGRERDQPAVVGVLVAQEDPVVAVADPDGLPTERVGAEGHGPDHGVQSGRVAAAGADADAADPAASGGLLAGHSSSRSGSV